MGLTNVSCKGRIETRKAPVSSLFSKGRKLLKSSAVPPSLMTVYHNANAGFAKVHNLTRWEEIEEFAEREKVILYVYKYFRLVKIVKPSRLKEEKYV